MTTELATIPPVEQAVALIEQATDATEVIDLRTQLKAAIVVQATRGAALDAMNKLRLLDLLCGKKLGEMSKTLPDARKAPKKKSNSARAPDREVIAKAAFLASAGISLRDASRFEQLAERSTEELRDLAKEATAKGQKLSMRVALAPSSQKGYEPDEFYTPVEIIEAARKTMGSIDLDPCSCKFADKVVKAGRIYTKEDDGLTKPLAGNIWCNPAFTLGAQFAELLMQAYGEGRLKGAPAKQVCLLLNSATETAIQQRLSARFVKCELAKRLSFTQPDGTVLKGNRYAQTVWYMGSKHASFLANWSAFGVIVGPKGGA